MVTNLLKVVIDYEAKLQLRSIYRYIKNDSPENAEKVRSKILTSIKELIKYPEMHAPDKYRLDGDKSYRAYEIYKHRVTYHISAKEIRIIRIRHSKMNPLEY